MSESDKTTFIIILIFVLIIFYFCRCKYSESFKIEQLDDSDKTILIFVSNSCHHCIAYIKEHHDKVVELCKERKITLKLIYPDQDPDNLFEKFNIEYVPRCYIMKDNKILKNVNTAINAYNLKNTLEQINNN